MIYVMIKSIAAATKDEAFVEMKLEKMLISINSLFYKHFFQVFFVKNSFRIFSIVPNWLKKCFIY